MEEGKRHRNRGKQGEDELRLGHRECEVSREMSNAPWREAQCGGKKEWSVIDCKVRTTKAEA